MATMALEALYAPDTHEGIGGHLHSIKETQGASQAPSPYPDTWLIRGSIRVGAQTGSVMG